MAFDLLKLLDTLAPQVRNAFLAAIDDVLASTDKGRLEQAIASGSIDEVMATLPLEPEFFAPVNEALRTAYAQAGAGAMGGLPRLTGPNGARVVSRFDIRSPRAEQWLRNQSSRLITEVREQARDAVRTVLEPGVAAGRGPRSVALDIVGRVDRTTGRRTGGVVGLHSSQARAVARATEELTSGNADDLAAYLRRKRRDRRFDGIVKRAIREGRPVPAEQARKMAARYSDRLLQLRGETIGRTEMLQSMHAAQDEGLRQLIDKGHVKPEQVVRTWDSSEDGATRDTHRAMDGQEREMGRPFESPSGAKLLHPGDRTLGAPAAEIINCRCVLRIDVDYLKGLKKRELDLPLEVPAPASTPPTPLPPDTLYTLKPTGDDKAPFQRPHKGSSGTEFGVQEVAHNLSTARRALPSWLMAQLDDVPVEVMERGARAYFDPKNSSVKLAPQNGADVVVHEMFHALDWKFAARGQQGERASLSWKTNDRKLNSLAAKARLEFLNRDSKGKGQLGGGDGDYLLGDWEANYEARLYSWDKDGISSEYVSMGAQRYYQIFKSPTSRMLSMKEQQAARAEKMRRLQPAMVELMEYLFSEL